MQTKVVKICFLKVYVYAINPTSHHRADLILP